MSWRLPAEWSICITRWIVGVTLVPMFLGELASAAQPDWQTYLSRSIVARDIPEREVLAYCASRVAQLPRFQNVADWTAYAQQLRAEILREVVLQGEGARWQATPGQVEWLDDLPGGTSYRVRRLRYEALPGLWIPALLYEPRELLGRLPVILNVNGHDGEGKAADYKQRRCIHLVQNGMLALNVEWLGMGELRTSGLQHGRMNQLDLCGTSGLAPFFLAMQRGLDLLLEHPHADSGRVAVAGLSGGGWQTILLSALDTRVTLANPVAGYSSFLTRIDHHSDLGDSEQTPVDLAVRADYTHLTALLAPRRALLTYNLRDNCCFASDHALPPLLAAAEPVYEHLGVASRLSWHVNADPGTHNFERDNRQALYRTIREHFFGQSEEFPVDEQIRDEEILSLEQARVGVPEQQQDFTHLARELAADLPHDAGLPADAEQWSRWRRERADRLLGTVRFPEPVRVAGLRVATEHAADVEVTYWKLAVGEEWTVPAVEFVPPDPDGSVVLVGDRGRASLAPQVERWLEKQHRVIAVDPFYWGESALERRGYLFALLVSSVGERPLGLQASQLTAVAKWLGERHDSGPIGITAVGPRATLAALVAGALEPTQAVTASGPAEGHIAFLELEGALGSLREVLEQDLSVEQAPELFCFGLLRDVDIPQLVAMQTARELRLVNPTQRVVDELDAAQRLRERLWQRDFEDRSP